MNQSSIFVYQPDVNLLINKSDDNDDDDDDDDDDDNDDDKFNLMRQEKNVKMLEEL